MTNFCANCGHSIHAMNSTVATSSPGRSRTKPKKVKRAPSAYNKRYAVHYKRLKKAHPRSSFAALAKKAHKASRRK